jgi:hypothetical protein
MVAILMSQRLMDLPSAPPVFRDFWTSVYQAFIRQSTTDAVLTFHDGTFPLGPHAAITHVAAP